MLGELTAFSCFPSYEVGWKRILKENTERGLKENTVLCISDRACDLLF